MVVVDALFMILGEKIGDGFEDNPPVISSFLGFLTTSYGNTGSKINAGSDGSF